MPKRQVHFEIRRWDDDFCIPVAQFLKEITDALAGVPEDMRDLVQLEFDRTGSDYDYSRGEMSLHYTRPESDDELRQREDNERASEAARVRAQEARERSEFLRLKAKFNAD